jgi:lactate permease
LTGAIAATFPILVVVGVLAARGGAVLAGGLGLAATLGPALATGRLAPPEAALQLLRGGWLALQVILVVAAGLLFHGARGGDEPAAGGETAPSPFAAAFLLGPFAECATGFGVGWLVAFAALRARGLAAPAAALLGLFSQVLVPWGALAVGTRLGADLAGLEPRALGLASAEVTALLLAGHLVAFEALARRVGLARPAAATLEDALWLAALGLLLVRLSPRLDLELVGLVASGLLLALRWLRDVRPGPARLAATLRGTLDYGCLVTALLAVRLVPAVAEPAQRLLVLRPAADLPPLPLLRSPASWLLVVALGFLVARRGAAALGPALRAAGRRAWTPCLATLLFVAMATVYGAAGLAAAAAQGLLAMAGPAAILAVPGMAALAGFLTASNAGSNSLLMPIVAALAPAAGIALEPLGGVLNAVASTFTLLSPPRLGLAAVLAGSAAADPLLLRRALPTAALALALATLWTGGLLLTR